jgi:hypothetical protein
MATARTKSRVTAEAHDLPEWARYIIARWGLHTKAVDPEIWERIFTRCLGKDWTEQEIMETVDWQKSEGQNWKKPDSADSIVLAVRTFRKRAHSKPMPRDKELDPDRVNEIARAMKGAPDNAARWDILCDGAKTLKECQKLDDWAAERFDGWDADVTEIKRDMAHGIRAAMAGIAEIVT